MTFRKKVFTSQKISIAIGNVDFRVQALVSAYGAKYVFEENEIPSELKYLLKDEVRVLYRNLPVRGVLVQEHTTAGSIYHLRFVEPSFAFLKQVEKDIEDTGIPSPWLRALPRLSTEVRHLPVPVLAILNYRGSTLYLNIKNFTLGGLLLEYLGPELSGVEVGEKFEIDVVVNSGEKIADLSAVVRNRFSEANASSDTAKDYFGIKLLPMSLLNENKYRSLIRTHCEGLKNEMTKKIVKYS